MEVVPVVEVTFTANSEFAHTIFTDVEKVYSLDTVPVEWTELKDSAKIVRPVFMTAALQAMDQNDLSRFDTDSNDQLVWFPPKTGQCEVKIHPLELLQCSPFLKRKLIAAVRADKGFGVWVREIAHSKRPLVEKIMRGKTFHQG